MSGISDANFATALNQNPALQKAVNKANELRQRFLINNNEEEEKFIIFLLMRQCAIVKQIFGEHNQRRNN